MLEFWNSFFYEPIYNLLIAIVSFIPGHSVGFAIIVLTLIIKFILLPLTLKASRTQRAMKEIEPFLKEVKEKYGKDQKMVAQKTMELYQKHGVNPFSGCLPLLVQLPFLIALYQIVYKGLEIHTEFLYWLTPHPDTLNLFFFNFSLSEKSLIFGLLAGVTQLVMAYYMAPNATELFKKPKKEGTTQEEFARSMQIQMLTVFPLLIAFIGYTYGVAVALYLITSNMFGIGQELLLNRQKRANA